MIRPAFLIAIAFASNVFAQSTVQDLLDAGAKKLSTAQIQALMPETIFSGKMSQGYETNFKLLKDGSFTGNVYPNGASQYVWGSWRIEDDSYCMNIRYSGTGTNNFCNSIFELAGKYFVSGAKATPTSKVQERAFKPL